MRAFPVAALAGPLVLRRKDNPLAEDYSVHIDVEECGRLSVGRILQSQRPDLARVWLWTITGPAAPEAPVGLSGETESLDAAKAAFRDAFERLKRWAMMAKDGELPWLPGAAP
jgi:hypothetical protein